MRSTFGSQSIIYPHHSSFISNLVYILLSQFLSVGITESVSMEQEFAIANPHDSNPLHFVAHLIESAFHHLFCFVFQLEKPKKHVHGLNCSSQDLHQNVSSWRVRVSMAVIHLLLLLQKPVAFLGDVVEFCLNVIAANKGVLRTLLKLFFHPSGLVIPTPEYARSFVGQMDSRWDIPQVASKRLEAAANGEDPDVDSAIEAAATAAALADPSLQYSFPSAWSAQVCVMAAKLVYENRYFVQRVVEKRWKMHFVDFYDCWNAYLRSDATQAFMFMDKAEDANAIVVAFRGTSPFEFYDYCTDMDFSWFSFPQVGKVHVGFLEALGLCSRRDHSSFMNMKNLATKKAQRLQSSNETSSGLSEGDRVTKQLAYDTITSQLRDLLKANPRAKVYVTGHSLGGALATLFGGIVLLEDDEVITPRLQGIITFGQPRVGDKKFANFLESHLCTSESKKYVRVVYNFDMPARIPFDDPVFNFKHCGVCHYHASRFLAEVMEEEPHKNYLSLLLLPSTYMMGAWEILESVILKYYAHYGETWFSVFCRVVGFFIPGLCAHNPANYVNAVLMGPSALYHATGDAKKGETGFLYGLRALFLQLRELRQKRKKVAALRKKRLSRKNRAASSIR